MKQMNSNNNEPIWRSVYDEKYLGYSIQERRSFLWWEWWSSRYLSGSESEAKRMVEKFNGIA